MRIPKILLRKNPKAHKGTFGHVLILAGSPRMVGAAALCGLAAMRSGAGLVTLGIPKSLNGIVQKKISPVIMTLPLKETREGTLALAAFSQIEKSLSHYNAIAIGPGLTTHPHTRRFIWRIIETTLPPLVIDADALNALAVHLKSLPRSQGIRILTPHPGEMARLTKRGKEEIERNRSAVARDFSRKYRCILILKGHHSIVASPDGRLYLNKTGNPGMATAGSGDVLTGMITAFLGQGLEAFEAARFAVCLHGKAGDRAARQKTKIAMIATDLIEQIPHVLRQNR